MSATISRQSVERLTAGILSTERVSGLTHNFYRYPARFSPEFVRAVITEFSSPGDLVYDPFMGGGTTLVEALALGRDAIGTDISSLATFISKVKTTPLSNPQLINVALWLEELIPVLVVNTESSTSEEWIRRGYQKNINDASTWRIRKLLEIALSTIETLGHPSERQLARCIILKTGQWALDCRAEIPSTRAFQNQLATNAREMIDAAHQFASVLKSQSSKPRSLCVHRSAIGVENEKKIAKAGSPKLVLTSPPYPGLHVLYHRWQVRGRKETAAPFWIAGTQDGDGSAFYTFGDRKQVGLARYFADVTASFRSIHAIADSNTVVVQMLAFSEPDWQLPRYLEAMAEAGFKENHICDPSESSGGRVWRSVPSRKWYANRMGQTSGSQEVVLFHKKN
jgi:hypothetical protein